MVNIIVAMNNFILNFMDNIILFQHDPCEEYIDGLTAQPWWDASQFEWVAGLEVRV